MKKSLKKWWGLNVNLAFILLLSFILSLLYCFYYNLKLTFEPLGRFALLSSMTTKNNLETINTNMTHLSAENERNDENINNSNFTQWTTAFKTKNKNIYTVKMSIKYTPNKDSIKYIPEKNIMLNMNLFYQEKNYWCGPAVLQMIIKYFKHRFVSQLQLVPDLGTKYFHGTYPEYMLKGLKKYVSAFYINKKLHKNYAIGIEEQRSLYCDIKNSLEHNLPVSVAFQGRYPWINYNIGHFNIIYGIRVVRKFKDFKYLILDPKLGKIELKQSEMYNLFSLNDYSQISLYNKNI